MCIYIYIYIYKVAYLRTRAHSVASRADRGNLQ